MHFLTAWLFGFFKNAKDLQLFSFTKTSARGPWGKPQVRGGPWQHAAGSPISSVCTLQTISEEIKSGCMKPESGSWKPVSGCREVPTPCVKPTRARENVPNRCLLGCKRCANRSNRAAGSPISSNWSWNWANYHPMAPIFRSVEVGFLTTVSLLHLY